MNYAKRMHYIVYLGFALSGCAAVAPSHDVPTDNRGVSITRPITDRIQCELAELVRPYHENIYEHQRKLLQEDYVVSILLILGVTDKAGLSPSLNFPLSPNLSFGLNLNVDQSREDGQTIELSYSMRKIYDVVSKDPSAYQCSSQIETNLAGNLGLRRRVSTALEADGRPRDTIASPSGGEFSGTINFITTKAIRSAGPTWILPDFVGPRELLYASRVDNNKVTYGFSAGPNAGKPLSAPLIVINRYARTKFLVERQISIDFGNQLSGLRSSFR